MNSTKRVMNCRFVDCICRLGNVYQDGTRGLVAPRCPRTHIVRAAGVFDTIKVGCRMVNIGQNGSMPRGTRPIDIEQVQYRPSAESTLDLEVFSMSDLRRR